MLTLFSFHIMNVVAQGLYGIDYESGRVVAAKDRPVLSMKLDILGPPTIYNPRSGSLQAQTIVWNSSARSVKFFGVYSGNIEFRVSACHDHSKTKNVPRTFEVMSGTPDISELRDLGPSCCAGISLLISKKSINLALDQLKLQHTKKFAIQARAYGYYYDDEKRLLNWELTSNWFILGMKKAL